MFDNSLENLSPARVLADIVHFVTMIEYEQERDDFTAHVVMFHDKERETSFINFSDPDEFAEDIHEAIEIGWRPIALEAVEDEEHDYKCVALEYLLEEPSLEDEAIIEAMFDTTMNVVA